MRSRRELMPKLKSWRPVAKERLSLTLKRVARRPCTQLLSRPPSAVNGALDPMPSRTIGNAARVWARSTGPNRLSYHENAKLDGEQIAATIKAQLNALLD